MEFLLGHGLSDIGFIWQLYNALFFVVVVSNWEQIINVRRQWMFYLAVVAVPDLFWLTLFFYQDHQTWFLKAIELLHGIPLLPFLPIRLMQRFMSQSLEQGLLSFSITTLILILLTNSRKRSNSTLVAVSIGLFVGIFLLQSISGIHLSLLVQFRLAAISAAFFIICYFDIRRKSPFLHPSDLFPYYVAALLKTMLLFPFLIIIIGAVFLIVITITDAIGIPSIIVDTPVYIGVLYGPFTVVYWMCQRDKQVYFKGSHLPS